MIFIGIAIGLTIVVVLEYVLGRSLSFIRRHRSGHFSYYSLADLVNDISVVENKTLPIVIDDGWKKFFVGSVSLKKDGKLPEHILITASNKKLNDVPREAEFELKNG